MKYYCNLHSRWGYPMGRIEGNNKQRLVEEAQWHMYWLSKRWIMKNYIKKENHTHKECGNP